MIIVEGLIFCLVFYLFMGFSTYGYAVLKSWEITEVWNFEIKDGYIAGICKYPRWLLGWVESIKKRWKR